MLEVIVLRPEDALQARACGAQRLELVSAIELGGLTPDASLVQSMVEQSGLPVMVMVRPHARSFVYDVADMQAIRSAIETAKQYNADGIVFGSLTEQGAIDTDQLEQVIAWAEGLSITFHRAFDEARDLPEAYQTLCGYRERISRLLTSGGAANAVDGSAMLAYLQAQTNGLEILVGAGINAQTLPLLRQRLGGQHFHSGGGARVHGSYDQPLSADAIGEMRRLIDTPDQG